MARILLTEHWNKWLMKFPLELQDVYFTEEYVRLYANDSQKAVCYIYEEGDSFMIFPFLLRPFEYQNEQYFDFETAYGYGGPLVNVQDEEFSKVALMAFMEECKNKNVIAGFVRFCPWLKNFKICSGEFKVFLDRHTVAMNLSQSIDDVWMKEIHTKNRNVIKKAGKDGLVFMADYDFKFLPDFVRLYNETMDKLHASEFYYFDYDYYHNLIDNIPNKFLGVTLYQGKVICAAIFIYQGIYGHYHLSGSDRNYLHFNPNNFLLWNAAKELQNQGVKLFHLGGGTTSDENDSLLGFKQKFSKSLYDFYLGKIIFNETLYNNICSDWESHNQDKKESYRHFLLKYKY